MMFDLKEYHDARHKIATCDGNGVGVVSMDRHPHLQMGCTHVPGMGVTQLG